MILEHLGLIMVLKSPESLGKTLEDLGERWKAYGLSKNDGIIVQSFF